MSNPSVGTNKTAGDTAAPSPDKEKRRRRPSGQKVKAGSNAVRSRVASVVWLVAVACALVLAVGALLIALNANEENSIVKVVLDGAAMLDGPFSRTNGIFEFVGQDAATKNALVNWGLAAVAFLLIGKIADRVIRP